jgi:AbrB family looped-hinge helix DNA binding protein
MEAVLTTNLDPAGRVVVPAEYRKALRISPGSEVILVWEGDGVRITTHELEVKRAQALVKQYIPAGVSLVDDLEAERQREIMQNG